MPTAAETACFVAAATAGAAAVVAAGGAAGGGGATGAEHDVAAKGKTATAT
jgi:hypothetical protein